MRNVILFFALLGAFSIVKGQDFKYGKVSEEELAEQVHPRDADADAAVLYRDEYSHIEYSQSRGFILTTQIFERIKLYNADGFSWGTKEIGLYLGKDSEKITGLHGVTYTLKDGKIEKTKLGRDGIFEEERSKDFSIKKFTMPGLEPGCVIEYEYTLISPYISTINEIRLQEEIPLNRAEVRFYAPDWLGYKSHQKGALPITMVEETQRARINSQLSQSTKNSLELSNIQENIYKISVSDVPAMKREKFSSNLNNFMSAIKFELSFTKYPRQAVEFYSTTWEDVSKSIYDSESFGGQLKSDRYFNEEIDQLISGLTDDKEKVITIFEFIKKKMTWNGYAGMYTDEGLRESFKKGSGNSADINLLLVAMLRYAGLDADPVILSTRKNGIPVFPTRNGFNFVIASAKVGEQNLLMDGTNKVGEINLLEEELLNWNGRRIQEDGNSEWVNLYPDRHATESTLLNVTIADDLSTTGKVQSRYEGNYALTYRKRFMGKDDAQIRAALESMHSGSELEAITLENLTTPYKPVEASYDFESLTGTEEIGGKLYFSPLFHLTTSENPFKSEERLHPIDFIYPWKDRFVVNISIPDGYQVESLPESLSVGMAENIGSFKYAISSNGNTVQLSAEIAMNTSMINATYYQDLRKFYELLVAKQKEKVVLVKI